MKNALTAINIATGVRRLKLLGMSIKDGVMEELRAKDNNREAVILEYDGRLYHCIPLGRIPQNHQDCCEIELDKE